MIQKATLEMEDLLFFLTGNIKKSGLTVNEFCSQVGISRQKFYRFVKEPFRFTEQNIKRIKEVLHMDEVDASRLDSLLGRETQPSSFVDPTDYNRLISDLLSRKPSDEISVNRFNIEYLDESGSAAVFSPEVISCVLAGFGVQRENVDEALSQKHEYAITIYNCTITAENFSSREYAFSKSILTIARIVRLLESILDSSRGVRIRVRHYLSGRTAELMMKHDIKDKAAICFNIRLFTDVLPLLSSVLDYSIDTAGVTRRFWTDHSDLCLIEHRYTCEDGMTGSRTEYFAMVFSGTGDCSVCRLGSEEAVNIFRFLSIDTRDKISMPSGHSVPANPNQSYFELDKEYKNALIHPDLCFDDIPKDMWLALYETAMAREDSVFFETVFRKLIDPYDQYAFLDFDALVHLAVDILDQRSKAGSSKGKIVVCHPEGLKNFVKTGIITDLITEEIDYTGKNLVKAPLRFPAHMVVNLLKLIRDNIIRRMGSAVTDPAHYDWTNYYILKPQNAYPEVSYVINREYGVFPVYNKSRHKNTITNAYQNPAVGTLFYDYVVNKIIGRHSTEMESDILSDEHSIAFLDKLIAKAEKEQ
jgi:hypothetical protein